jgi:hypothetical protein
MPFTDYRLAGDPIPLPGKWWFANHRLRPNTRYRVYIEDEDVSSKCQAENHTYGDTTKLVSDSGGYLGFYYFFGNDISPRSTEEKMSHFNSLQVDKSRLRLVRDDGSMTVDSPDSGRYIKSVKDDVYEYGIVDFDYIQSFFVDPNAVNGSDTVTLSGVKLFFKNKPRKNNNNSGIYKPNAMISIVDMDGGVSGHPKIDKKYKNSTVIVPYDSVFTSSDASVAVEFNFSESILLSSGKSYGIAISFDDSGYELWMAIAGDRTLGTNTPSPGAQGSHDGSLFQRTNASAILQSTNQQNLYRELNNTDLKFSVIIARYTSNTATVDLVNMNYEFFTVSDFSSTSFLGGELVYQNNSTASGNISVSSTSATITGDSGTNFGTGDGKVAIGMDIIITDGTTDNTDIRTVESVVSNTEIIVDAYPSFTANTANYIVAPIAKAHNIDYLRNEVILVGSSATNPNTAYNQPGPGPFTVGSTVVGIDSGATFVIQTIDNYKIHSFISDLSFYTPSQVQTVVQYEFTDSDTYTMGALDEMDMIYPNYLENYVATMASRSNEVLNSANLWKASANQTDPNLNEIKSGHIKATFNYQKPATNLFESPFIRGDGLTIATTKWLINNDVTNEHTRYGNALSKHITKKLEFGTKLVEDVRIYLTAWRPVGTDIKVYAKIHNSTDNEAFDDKNWTLLDVKTNAEKYASVNNKADRVEYTYGFPYHPPVDTQLPGYAKTQLSNTTVTGVGTNWLTTVTEGDILRFKDPLFEEIFFITSVANVESDTVLYVNEEFPNESTVGDDMIVETLSTPHTAFINKFDAAGDQINVVRYFNNSGAVFDNYNSIQVKIVMTCEDENSDNIVPFVDDIRVIGVSA